MSLRGAFLQPQDVPVLGSDSGALETVIGWTCLFFLGTYLESGLQRKASPCQPRPYPPRWGSPVSPHSHRTGL